MGERVPEAVALFSKLLREIKREIAITQTEQNCQEYEQAYKPRGLRNWEVPKVYIDKPKSRSGRTEIVSNDRGHLLPGIPKSLENPWGNFRGTWHLPRKIDRQTADELNGTSKKITCEEKRQALKKLAEIKEEQEKVEEAQPAEVAEVPEAQESEPPPQVEETKPVEDKAYPYVPGDFTDDHQRASGYEELALNRYQHDKPKSKGYPKYRDDFSKPLPKIETKTISRDEVEEEYEKIKAMAVTTYSPPPKEVKHGRKKSATIIDAIRNFQLAKRLHRENLEHDPLPDTIIHNKYRKLQMQKSGKEPGLALDNENYATGVGWKGYPGYGPTRCTKLKVYRPKTCGHGDKHELKNDGRPSSVTSFDKKWRFIRQRKVSPIELAICWDLTPENPTDEPKRTPHIDGSNGSLAPAVFSLVHTPKEEESRKASVGTLDSVPLFEKAPIKKPDETDFVLDRPKTSYPRRTSRGSVQSGESMSKKRAKSAYNLNNNNGVEEEDAKSCSHCSHEEAKNLHQSTPNLSHSADKKIKNSRLCMACEMKNVSLKDRRAKKDEYKMAFKAGVPQKCKDKRQDYPEHWRLATVYQHSYKPIHTRKRPLLATVFK